MELEKVKNMKSVCFDECFNNWKPGDDLVVIKLNDVDIVDSEVWYLDKDLFDFETFKKEAVDTKTIVAEMGAGDISGEDPISRMLIVLSNDGELFAILNSNLLAPVTVITGIMTVLSEMLEHMEGEAK